MDIETLGIALLIALPFRFSSETSALDRVGERQILCVGNGPDISRKGFPDFENMGSEWYGEESLEPSFGK